jgi:hypothetical protein
VKPKLRVEVVASPHPDADREYSAALDLIADLLAERCIARARSEIASEMGVDERSIDHERGRDAMDAGADLPFAVAGGRP